MSVKIWRIRSIECAPEWIDNGNVPEVAYTESELSEYSVSRLYSDAIEEVNSMTFEYGGNTYSGSKDSQNEMTTLIAKMLNKGDTETRILFTIDKVKVKLTRDDIDNMLDIIDTKQELILDTLE